MPSHNSKFKIQNLKFDSGFTLIELLVVIAIIGILAALATISYSDSQRKARDSKRKADLEAIRKALELAKQDSAGGYSYPLCRQWSQGNQYTASSLASNECYLDSAGSGTQGPLAFTTSTYISKIPVDPKSPSAAPYLYYAYLTYDKTGAACGSGCTTATSYSLVTCLENKVDIQRDSTPDTTTCPWPTTQQSYTIKNF